MTDNDDGDGIDDVKMTTITLITIMMKNGRPIIRDSHLFLRAPFHRAAGEVKDFPILF